MAEVTETTLIAWLADRGALAPDRAEAALRTAARRAAAGRRRPAVLVTLFERGEIALEDVLAAARALGLPPVCERCGSPAQPRRACPHCAAPLADADRLTEADLWLARSIDDLAPGLPVGGGSGGLGRYAIEQRLGRGGMGVVLGGRDRALERAIAIKVIRTDRGHTERRVQRFLREGRVLAQLQHPAIVRVYEAGEHRGRLYLVMERIEGRSLASLRESDEIGIEAALEALETVARALETAHAAGVVHRDVKPANIVIDRRSKRARLIDFGLAQEVVRAGSITVAGLVVGSPHYLSPEQIRGAVELDGRADVWALGVCLYEVLAGRRPFDGASPVEVVSEIMRGRIPPLGARAPARALPAPVRSALLALVQQALQHDRERRPGSARAFADRLRAAREGARAASAPVESAHASGRVRVSERRTSRARTRSSAPWVAALVVLLLAVALAAGRLAGRGRGPQPAGALAERRAAHPVRAPVATPVPARSRPEAPPAGASPAVVRPGAVEESDEASGAEEHEGEAATVAAPSTTTFGPPAPPEPLPPAPVADEPDGGQSEPGADAADASPGSAVVPPPAAPAAAPALPPVPGLGDRVWQARALVAAALVRHPREAAVAALRGALDDPEPIVRALALRALANCPDAALRTLGGRRLLERLRSDDEPAVRTLLERLGSVSAPGAEIDPAMPPLAGEDLAAAARAGRRLADLERRGGLQLVALLDVTTSMRPQLDEIRRELVRVHALAARLVGRCRLGVVTYGEGVVAAFALAQRPAAVRRIAEAIVPEDNPANRTVTESVDAAFRAATDARMRWRGGRAARVVLVLGDAPPPKAAVPGLVEGVARLARTGRLRLGAVRFAPPERLRRKADPQPVFDELALAGKGRVVPRRPGRSLAAEILAAALDLEPALLEPVVEIGLSTSAHRRSGGR